MPPERLAPRRARCTLPVAAVTAGWSFPAAEPRSRSTTFSRVWHSCGITGRGERAERGQADGADAGGLGPRRRGSRSPGRSGVRRGGGRGPLDRPGQAHHLPARHQGRGRYRGHLPGSGRAASGGRRAAQRRGGGRDRGRVPRLSGRAGGIRDTAAARPGGRVPQAATRGGHHYELRPHLGRRGPGQPRRPPRRRAGGTGCLPGRRERVGLPRGRASVDRHPGRLRGHGRRNRLTSWT